MLRSEKITDGPIGVGTRFFEPVDGATRMIWSWEISPKGPLRLLGLLIARLGRRQEQTIWTGLKAQLEGNDGQVSLRSPK